VPFDGVGFRSVGMRYATEGDLVSGHGAGYYGGRWNPPGLRAVYLSSSPLTAVREAYQVFLHHGIPAAQVRPRVLAGLRIQALALLDLTDARLRRRLGFRLRDLVGEDWATTQRLGGEAWTQRLGRCAAELGFEGLRAPSAHDRGGTNLVLYPDHLLPGSGISVVAAEDLPAPPPPEDA